MTRTRGIRVRTIGCHPEAVTSARALVAASWTRVTRQPAPYARTAGPAAPPALTPRAPGCRRHSPRREPRSRRPNGGSSGADDRALCLDQRPTTKGR